MHFHPTLLMNRSGVEYFSIQICCCSNKSLLLQTVSAAPIKKTLMVSQLVGMRLFRRSPLRNEVLVIYILTASLIRQPLSLHPHIQLSLGHNKPLALTEFKWLTKRASLLPVTLYLIFYVIRMPFV